MVTNLDRRDALADLFDDTSALMAEHTRRGGHHGAVLHRQVGVTDARRSHADLHLAGAGCFHLDVVSDLEWLVDTGEDSCLGHVVLPANVRLVSGI